MLFTINVMVICDVTVCDSCTTFLIILHSTHVSTVGCTCSIDFFWSIFLIQRLFMLYEIKEVFMISGDWQMLYVEQHNSWLLLCTLRLLFCV